MALFTEEKQITLALEQSKALEDEKALAQALEDLVIQESEQDLQDSEPSHDDILAMICAFEGGAAEGNDPSEEKYERQDLFEDKPVEDKPVEDTIPSIFRDGNLIFFKCPHPACDRVLSVHENDTNCRQFVCVGSVENGTFADPHSTQQDCTRLINSGEWTGCGCAFTLPADGSPPQLRTHG